jgi:phosphoribosylamine--glycine ligase
VVIKADGLALGKGVIVAHTKDEAKNGLKLIMRDGGFGHAGENVVIEEFLEGFEVSVLAFTDGKTIVPMVSSQDHKKIFDGDKGPNTGGMGAFSPSRRYNYELSKKAYDSIFLPTLKALNAEGREFKGVIYFGLMIDKSGGIKVLEYNARFGDPETQAILPRLDTDLLDVFDACIDGDLDKINISWNSKSCVCGILASEGYPGKSVTGREITIGDIDSGILLFFAGASFTEGKLVTSGGRVVGVTAVADTLLEARAAAYKAALEINFEGMQYRKDICV